MIFYRIDDLGPDVACDIALLEAFEEMHIPYIAAIVPKQLSRPMAWRLCNSTYATVFQHGVDHSDAGVNGKRNEFPSNMTRMKERIAGGRALLEDAIGRTVYGYAPPWNNVSSGALRVLEELGFNWLSGHVRNQYWTRMSQLNVCIDPIHQYRPLGLRSVTCVYRRAMFRNLVYRKAGIVFHPSRYPHSYLCEIAGWVRRTTSLSYSAQEWSELLTRA